jgi:TRAP-type C4-dicarboxylate transport system permease small subunit
MSQFPDGGDRRPTLVDRLGESLTQVCLAIAAASLLCIVGINGANVVARYLFLSPFSWGEELMLFLMILSVFSGAIAITWRNMHIRIDTFVDQAPPAVRQVIMAAGALMSIAAIGTIVYASATIVSLLRQIDQRSDALDLPSWIPQSFLTIGLAVTALLIAVRTVQALLRGPKVEAARPDVGK